MTTIIRLSCIVLFLQVMIARTAMSLDLPDPLTTSGGEKVCSVDKWEQVRRPEILDLFRTYVYGRAPEIAPVVTYETIEAEGIAFEGKATRRQVRMTIRSGGKSLSSDILIYLPKQAEVKPVPGFLILNFGGNHTVNADPEIILATGFFREAYAPPEEHRGFKQSRYPVEAIIDQGYCFVTAYYCDFDPDFDDGFRNGLHGLFDPTCARAKDAWGSISAWAWGLSRIMDYIEKDADIDQGKIALVGHSRLGKTALWAGAQDERFSVVISNDSGCTGAAIARNKKGERVKDINDVIPYWVCDNYKAYSEKEEDLPVDQHMLVALMAPRPVYVASASLDTWADPEGEFMACVEAQPVFSLYGLKGLGAQVMPEPEQPLNTGSVGYHLRTGKHDLTAYDWERFMDFASRHWNAD